MQKNVHVFCNKDIWKKKERNVWVKFVKIMCNGFCFFGKNVEMSFLMRERERELLFKSALSSLKL